MAPARLLAERNVKPVRDVVYEDVDSSEDAAAMLADEGEEDISDDTEMSGADAEKDGMEDELEQDAHGQDISNVSFGALQHAQETMSRKRKRDADTDVVADQDEKLDALRQRLKKIKADRGKQSNMSVTKSSRSIHREDVEADDAASDSDSAPSEVEASKSRTSKHAPMSQRSNRQVTRRRTVVDVPKRVSRDPRFDALHQDTEPNGNIQKAYGFLRDYQKTEIAELKSAIKKAKSEDDKETLRRKMVSMENRIKSEDAKERRQEVLRKHRKEEKERIEQGKKPFFLKEKEVQARALVEKFKGMKGKDREKLLERRRRKEGQKEKKNMPEARRFGE